MLGAERSCGFEDLDPTFELFKPFKNTELKTVTHVDRSSRADPHGYRRVVGEFRFSEAFRSGSAGIARGRRADISRGTHIDSTAEGEDEVAFFVELLHPQVAEVDHVEVVEEGSTAMLVGPLNSPLPEPKLPKASRKEPVSALKTSIRL